MSLYLYGEIMKKAVIPDLRITASCLFLAAFPSSELPAQVQGVIPVVPVNAPGARLEFLSLPAPPANVHFFFILIS